MFTQLDNSEAKSSEAQRWKYVRRACLFGPPLLTVAFCGIYWPHIYSNFAGESFIFSLSLCAVAAILAGTYFFAYKFFDEKPFYFFIFASWVANALYLIPERANPTVCDASYFNYRLGVLLLTLVSSGLLLLALFTRGRNKPTKSTWIIVGVLVGLTGVGITSYKIYKLPPRSDIISDLQKVKNETKMIHICVASYTAQRTPNLNEEQNNANRKKDYEDYVERSLFVNDTHKSLAWLTLGPSILSFITVWAIGIALNVRLGGEHLGWKGNILHLTFGSYAVLQFFYPFLPYLQIAEAPWTPILFFIAQMAKVGNAFAMMGVLQSASAFKLSQSNQEAHIAKEEIRAKEAQLEVEIMKNQRKSELEDLGAITSSIKHDINTPMATMGTNIDTMKRVFQSNPDLIARLVKLEDSMDRIWATVKMVDFVRGDGEFYDREQFMQKESMSEVVHRAVRSVKNEIPRLKATDSKDFIKVEGRDVFVRAHLPMLEQVVVNVIKNALEAIEEAGRERGIIKINVGLTQIANSKYARWVKVEIEDNGCGIPEEHFKKLTTLFTTRSRKKPNSGIGLFIGKKILDIHGGKIQFDSVVGEWARVTLLLPEWNALQRAESSAGNGAPEALEEWNVEPTLPNDETEKGTASSGAVNLSEDSGGNA